MTPRAKNVLVTGASSTLGERLIWTLIEDSRVDEILAVTGDDPEVLPFPRSERVHAVQVDMRRNRKVHDMLFGPARELRIDVVVHLAQHSSPYREGSGVHAYNVEAARSIQALSERHPTIQRIVYRSDASVYQVQRDLPVLIGEHHPLNMSGSAPQWVRDRVEADVGACTRMGLSSVDVVVLRLAEILAPGTGSQIHDYLESPVCLRPAGYDPMINLLTLDDAAAALQKAVHSDAQGVFNIPGSDTLPLTAAIRKWGRVGIPIPGGWMTPLYGMRSRVTGADFRYGMNRRRFHYSGVLDGTRAREVLHYVPCHPIQWPAADPTPD